MHLLKYTVDGQFEKVHLSNETYRLVASDDSRKCLASTVPQHWFVALQQLERRRRNKHARIYNSHGLIHTHVFWMCAHVLQLQHTKGAMRRQTNPRGQGYLLTLPHHTLHKTRL